MDLDLCALINLFATLWAPSDRNYIGRASEVLLGLDSPSGGIS